MNNELRRKVTALRKRQPRLPIKTAVERARYAPRPDIEWKDNGGTGTVGKYTVRVKFTYDDDPMTNGTFTDTYAEGAIRHPVWRPNDHARVLRWYIGVTGTVAEHQADLRQAGYSRHDAWLTARSYVLEDLKRDAQPEQWVVTATVELEGVELGSATVGGIDVNDDESTGEQLAFCADDVIAEAIDQADDALARLIKKGNDA